MPVGFNSPARNLFLLGSSGEQVVTNFFKTIDQSAGTDGVYLPSEIKYNFVDQKFILAGSASNSNSKAFGWFEKRDQAGSADWDVRVEATSTGVNTTLRAMELDSNDNLIVVGKTGDVPWIAKYSNGGVIDWQSTTNSGDVGYTGITSDSNGNYYACGNTPDTGDAQAFVEKFDTNGNPGWGKSAFMLGRDVVLKKIAANSRGEVVAVGWLIDDVSAKGYIVKIDTNTGEVLWDRTIKSYEEDISLGYKAVLCEGVYIDSKDQIYVVGRLFSISSSKSFIIKYTAEGNMLWQRETEGLAGDSVEHYEVKSDGETEQTVVLSRYFNYQENTRSGMLSKYSKDGTLVWRRTIISSYNLSNTFAQTGGRGLGLDADPSFYYLIYIDDVVSGIDGYPDRYTYGKVSSSGNGLGAFEYTEGTGETVDYEILNIQDKIGRLSDGSVRNDTSDLITYPFNANNLLFDDLATQVANKRRQMDNADSFEYSGSPAIRPVDFPSLYLDAKNDARNGTVVDPDSGIVGTYNTFGPFPGSNSVYLGGTNANIDTYGWQGYIDLYVVNTGENSAAPFSAVGTDLWTMEAWFYITEYPSSRAILMANRHTQGGSYRETLLINSSGTLQYGYQEGLFGSNNNTIPLNTWVHIAMAKDPADDTKTMVLVNGTHSWSPFNGMSTGYSDTSFTARLGWTLWSFTSGYQYLKGYISNFRFSTDNVYGTTTAGNTYTVPTSTLGLLPSTKLLALHEGLSNYGFNPSNGYGILDQTTCKGPWASPVNNVFGTTQKYVFVQVLPHYTNAQVRGAKIYGLTDRVNREKGYWEFNGANDYIECPNPIPADPTSPFTFEVWVRREVSNTWQTIMSMTGSNTQLAFGSTNTIRFGRNGGGGGNNADSNFSTSTGTWYHVVGTYDGNQSGSNAYVNIYVNGVIQVSGTNMGVNGLNNGSTIRLGTYGIGSGGEWLNGKIGEARIYPKALTAGQVFQNYNATKSKYINKEPDTAPKIGPGIVYGSNLLLNYDFGNKATFDPKDTSFTKITPPTAGNGATFGYNTHQLSNGFVAGEPWNNNGVVYWYNKSGNNIATIADPTSSGYWGYYVYSDRDNRVLINMPYYNDGTSKGYLYVYDGSGNLLSTIPRPEYNPGVNHPTWNEMAEVAAIGEGKVAVMDERFYDPGTTNERGALWIMNEDGTNQIRVLSPEVTPGSGTFNQFNYNVFIDNGYVYVYTSVSSGNTWTVVDFNGNIIRDFLPTEDGAGANDFGYPAGAGEGRFIIGSDGGTLGIPAKTFIYDSTNNFNLVGTIDNTDYLPTGGDYETQSYHVYDGHIYITYGDRNGFVRVYDLNGNFEKQINGPEYLNETRLSNKPLDAFGYNNLVDLGGGSYAIAAPYDTNYDGAIYLLKPTTVKNLSSSSYTGTVGSATTFNSAGYFEFVSDTNSQIQTPTGLLQSGDSFTVEQWIYHSTSNSSTGNPFGYGKSPDVPANYAFVVHSSGPTGYYAFISDGSGTSASSPNPSVGGLSNNTWYHITWVVSGTNITAYLNGSLSNSENTGLASVNIQSDQYAVIGRDVRYVGTSSRHMTGGVGQTRLYNRALSPTEVSQNFNATRSKYGV